MHAHFRGHVYHRHSHETYSLGVTESGAQAFTCRGAGRVSTAGLVMAFNPDDPHDGHAAAGTGFTYRMIHLDPDLLTGAANSSAEVIAEAPSSSVGILPLTNFGTANFSNAAVNGAAIGNASPVKIIMVNPSGRAKDSVSALVGGQAFSVKWLHST